MRYKVWGVLAGLTVVMGLSTGFRYGGVPVNQGSGGEEFRFQATVVPLDQREQFTAVPLEWVRYAVEHHSYSPKLNALLGDDFPIYLTDRHIHLPGSEATAVAGTDGFILIGGTEHPDRAIVEETVLHELGHALGFQTMTGERWEAYRKLRGLGPEYLDSGPWEQRPAEIFAEDFAYLFGTGRATHRPWRMGRLDEPHTVPGLREFFLRLVDDPASPAPDTSAIALSDRGRPVARVELVYELAQVLPKPPGSRYRLPTDWIRIPVWAQAAVQQGLENGWVLGNPDGSFRPEEPVTRAQAAAMLARTIPRAAAGRQRASYADSDRWPGWAREAIARVQRAGLMDPRPGGEFAPDAPLTADEALQILERLRKGEMLEIAGTHTRV